MIAKTQNSVAGIFQKQSWIFGLYVIVLRRFPEVVPHHESVFVGQIIKNFFRILTDPVADDIQIGIAMQPEIRLQALARDTLARIVHAPVTPATRYAHSIHSYDQIGRRFRFVRIIEHPHRWRRFPSRHKRRHPRLPIVLPFRRKARRIRVSRWNFANAFMTCIYYLFILQPRNTWRILQSPQMACTIEQAQCISDFTNAESNLFAVGFTLSIRNAEQQRIQLRLAITVRPPEVWLLHDELREVDRCQLHRTYSGSERNFLTY